MQVRELDGGAFTAGTDVAQVARELAKWDYLPDPEPMRYHLDDMDRTPVDGTQIFSREKGGFPCGTRRYVFVEARDGILVRAYAAVGETGCV